MNTANPKKKRTKKALEKKHKDPLPITLANDSLTWTQYVVNALYNLIGWYHADDQHFSGEYSPEGGFIRITDNLDIQELYCKGFFGKGNLSRSEPTWSQRIAAEGSDSKQFLEHITEARRKQRKATRISKLMNTPPLSSSPSQASQSEDGNNNEVPNNHVNEILDTVFEEHLQLSLVEGFFLAYGLGCLTILNNEKQPLSILECWKLFCNNTLKDRSNDAEVISRVPLTTLQSPMDFIQSDNPFIVKYVVYHYYRSKAWVVKDGIKFGTDYSELNEIGIVLKVFAVIVIPSYHETSNKQENLSWSWILGMNRVCSQANKTLVLCYVNLPPQKTVHLQSPECLTQYSVTELAMKRWIPEKTRG
ncbi:hypothetical protein INT44_003539 [Umbelopsis vinacea]|uniref:tRNA-splicing endonuclease subunit Sen2 n=1 Tax=Umbelopsis vinacea TaxID=44442 RepID=A0A8H7PV91_9FUNG|nr:hypothetical protein INT44_003539 [Umbelopsis vinacea]